MKNLKIKIGMGLISLVAFILLLFAFGNKAFATVNSFSDVKSMNDLMDFAQTNNNGAYFNQSASSFIGVKYNNVVFDWTKYKTGYCIDHDQTGASGIYTIKHVIDVDLKKTSEKVKEGEYNVWYGAKVSVYGGTAGKVTEKVFTSGDSNAKAKHHKTKQKHMPILLKMFG